MWNTKFPTHFFGCAYLFSSLPIHWLIDIWDLFSVFSIVLYFKSSLYPTLNTSDLGLTGIFLTIGSMKVGSGTVLFLVSYQCLGDWSEAQSGLKEWGWRMLPLKLHSVNDEPIWSFLNVNFCHHPLKVFRFAKFNYPEVLHQMLVFKWRD